jgi:hypothetical protein
MLHRSDFFCFVSDTGMLQDMFVCISTKSGIFVHLNSLFSRWNNYLDLEALFFRCRTTPLADCLSVSKACLRIEITFTS